MQRIIVDLPEPDGPQMTMRSPRITLRSMSLQDVKLAVPLVKAGDLDRHCVGELGRLDTERGLVHRGLVRV